MVSQSPAQKKPLLILLAVGTGHERGRRYANDESVGHVISNIVTCNPVSPILNEENWGCFISSNCKLI